MSATLNIYPSPVESGDYLAMFKFAGSELPLPSTDDNKTRVDAAVRTIIILDNSGSMGGYVKWTNQKVLPEIFQTLNYDPTEVIDLILFESQTLHKKHTVAEFPTLPYENEGGTDLRGVFPILHTILTECHVAGVRNVRILTISDGEIAWQDEAVQAAADLNEKIQSQFNLQISSQAIRLFTSSYASPSTAALSSTLQFNTTASTPSLLDLRPKDSSDTTAKEAIDEILTVFGTDTPKAYLSLPGLFAKATGPDAAAYDDNYPESIFKQQPWASARGFLPLESKASVFWLSKKHFDPTTHKTFTISDVLSVTATVHDKLSVASYGAMMSSRFDYYMMQIKLLRVVGTEKSIERLKQISDYFAQLEAAVYKDVSDLDDTSMKQNGLTNLAASKLKQRLLMLQREVKTSNTRFAYQMAAIANMDAKTRFDSAQAATFLRTTTNNATSRGLVRRAGDNLDFDTTVRTEVRALAANLAELEAKITPEIESTFKQSFVSLANTMDGIRAVCALATTTLAGDALSLEEMASEATPSLLDHIPALDVLSYLNIVGVPCQAKTDNYPDPFRYQINVIYSGHYCSLSDIITQHSVNETQGGTVVEGLKVPGHKGDLANITNVIPLFDSPDIFHFLYKYAPQTLNYYASVGMRRVIADVPGTLPATLSAALVKIFKVAVVEPTEVNYTALANIARSLQGCSSFKYNLGCFTELLDAVHYIDGSKLGNFNTMKAALNETAAIGDANTAIQPGEAPPPTTTTNTPAFVPKITVTSYKTDSHLALITSSLTQLIFPLLQLYIVAETGTFLSKPMEQFIATSEKYKDAITPAVIKSALPSVLRAIYANESWTALRYDYRGLADNSGGTVLADGVASLLGIDLDWTNKIVDTVDDEVPFSPAMAADGKLPQFFGSDLYRASQAKLNRCNFLLTLPYFASVVNAAVFHQDQDKFKQLQTDAPPRVLSSLETANLLQQQDDMNELIQNTNNNADAVDDAIKIKIAAYKEEREGIKNEVNLLVNALWPQMFFGLGDDVEIAPNSHDNDDNLSQNIGFMKLLNIAFAYFYPQAADRRATPLSATPTNGPIYSTMPDNSFTDINLDNNNYIKFLQTYRISEYESMYNAAVTAKIKKSRALLADAYAQKLYSVDSIDEFKSLMTNGITVGKYTFAFDGFLDPLFKPFWVGLTNPDQEVALRVEKFPIVILGCDENGTAIWNQGRVLYNYSFTSVSKFFIDAGKRDEWVEISKKYAANRKWVYRQPDLPNRHGHTNSKPSYHALGYSSVAEYRDAVSEETWLEYEQNHVDCCGLRVSPKPKH